MDFEATTAERERPGDVGRCRHVAGRHGSHPLPELRPILEAPGWTLWGLVCQDCGEVLDQRWQKTRVGCIH